MNARLVWVTKYDLSFKKKREREKKRKIHFRSSGFSNQDFYTVTVLHLILCASFNYENKSSFINSSPWKLPTAGPVTEYSGNKMLLAQVHLRLPWRDRLLCWSCLSAKPEPHAQCVHLSI